ncbi:MAG: CDP-alcohol phosphatidyltransferase family protein [Thermofilaceae archaeon]|nr:CDP-alcohol phosphatidyltransferase family protein [Thermofilaceae archaeon]MDW8003709.1 CDP-alcohol phosphatidyltransferase family protein [Thermofilaceae archaeon]
MLNSLRTLLNKFLDKVFSDRVFLKPNDITLISLIFSMLVPIAAFLGLPPYVVACLLLLTAFLDVLDGYVARRTGLETKFGAFLDSTADRVSDTMYTIALMVCGVIDPLLTLIFISSEYLVSYTRARAEGLGVRLAGVGLMERGERVLAKAFILTLGNFSLAAAKIVTSLVILLTIATVVHRVVAVKRALDLM